MTDDEIETWIILKYGSIENAYELLDPDCLWQKGKNNTHLFSDQEIRITQKIK